MKGLSAWKGCCWPALIGVLLGLLPARCWGVQATLIGDAHVAAAQPTVNAGGLSNLRVGGGYTTLVQFDLGVLPPGSSAAQISRATLRLYVNRVDTAGPVSLQPVYGGWSEGSVTYASLPVLGTPMTTAQASTAGAFLTLDVTAQVQGWVNAPGSNFGLALSSASAAVQFDSKENDATGHLPELEIVLAPGAAGPVDGAGGTTGSVGALGAVGATGATGAAGAMGLPGAAGAPGPSGAPGTTGAAGVTGARGATGLTGATGPAGAGLVNYLGAYSATSNYANGDVVQFGGSTYISQTGSNHGNTPGLTNAWGLLAGAGAAGPTGAVGATGMTGQQGPPGYGVQGATGAMGATGNAGAEGRPGLVYQGAYSPTINYAAGDVVLWNGSSFASLVDFNHGNTPGLVPGTWGALTAQGPTGFTGAVGAGGPTGATGVQGPVGPPGERGEQGGQGIAGQAGAQGIAGTAGATGLQGPVGATGGAGPVGMSYQGSYSATGNYSVGQAVLWQGSGWVSLVNNNHGNTPDQSPASWGLFAAPGATGATGVGVAGATGATGLAGTNGVNGVNGVTGATGVPGTPGLVYQGGYSAVGNYALGDVVVWNGSSYASLMASNHGNTPGAAPGSWGLLTAQGSAGPGGAVGPSGATGPAGAVGPMGSPGPGGPQGAVGIMGAAGSPGTQGSTGATGAAGPAGAVGAAGPAGAQGLPGVTGGIGGQGVAGATGPAGPVGLSFQGSYNAATNYGAGQGVLWQGAGWVSLVNGNAGNTPDASPSAWAMFAAAGGMGATGATGVGVAGATGATGPTGVTGTAGTAGATGATGSAGMRFTGAYAASTSYGVGDGVGYAGASYISLVASNHGQTPDLSPSSWSLLAAQGGAGATGSPGAAGATGPTGAAGLAGANGAAGAAGSTGATGAVGINFRDAWTTSTRYAVNDAVTFAGSTYLALAGGTNQEPDQYPQSWSVVAEAGGVGPAGSQGPMGAAATVGVGTVTTLPAGASATVTNGGTSTAAVLNFGIPQGAAGGSGGAPAAVPKVPAMYHAVSFNYPYYAVNTPNSSATESASILAWMAQSCTASRLDVYSQQSGTIRVTLRLGSATTLNSTTMACTAASNGSCTVTGAVAVTSGQFIDLYIQNASGTASGVWTALECDP